MLYAKMIEQDMKRSKLLVTTYLRPKQKKPFSLYFKCWEDNSHSVKRLTSFLHLRHFQPIATRKTTFQASGRHAKDGWNGGHDHDI